jgi:hypothetical protein
MSECEIDRVVVGECLACDPGLHELPDGSAVCGLRLASERSRLRVTDARERARRARVSDLAVCMSAAVGYSEQLWC